MMGTFEYNVGLAQPKTEEEIAMVGKAFSAGQEKERERIWEQLEYIAKNGHISEALFSLRKIVFDD